MSAGNTSAMAKRPATPIPAQAGQSQRQGSARGSVSSPTHPPASEAASRSAAGAAGDGRTRWEREASSAGWTALNTVTRPAVAVASRPGLTVDRREPGDEQVVDQSLGGEERGAIQARGSRHGDQSARRCGSRDVWSVAATVGRCARAASPGPRRRTLRRRRLPRAIGSRQALSPFDPRHQPVSERGRRYRPRPSPRRRCRW